MHWIRNRNRNKTLKSARSRNKNKLQSDVPTEHGDSGLSEDPSERSREVDPPFRKGSGRLRKAGASVSVSAVTYIRFLFSEILCEVLQVFPKSDK